MFGASKCKCGQYFFDYCAVCQIKCAKCTLICRKATFSSHSCNQQQSTSNGATTIPGMPAAMPYNSPDEPDTIPMMPVAQKIAEPEELVCRLYYCDRCGCNYSAGFCPTHNAQG